MSNVTRLAVRSETAQANWRRGYDAGYAVGLAVKLEKEWQRGFWLGTGISAALVLIVTLTILMGKI